MIVSIPLDAYPNQIVTTTIQGQRWQITLNTRLGNIYASVENADGVIVLNRICLHGVPITKNLVFIDVQESNDPEYTGLNSRYLLVWTDET